MVVVGSADFGGDLNSFTEVLTVWETPQAAGTVTKSHAAMMSRGEVGLATVRPLSLGAVEVIGVVLLGLIMVRLL